MCWWKLTALCYPIYGTLISYTSIMCKMFVCINKVQCFSAYIDWSTISSFSLSTEWALQSYNKNDKSTARDDLFHVWSDASPELNIRWSPIDGQRVDTTRHIWMNCNAAHD
jgi:hypothetical protein